MTNLEYLQRRAAKDKAAETFLWQFVDVTLPIGEYTQAAREEAVFRMAHNVAVMQHQVQPHQLK